MDEYCRWQSPYKWLVYCFLQQWTPEASTLSFLFLPDTHSGSQTRSDQKSSPAFAVVQGAVFHFLFSEDKRGSLQLPLECTYGQSGGEMGVEGWRGTASTWPPQSHFHRGIVVENGQLSACTTFRFVTRGQLRQRRLINTIFNDSNFLNIWTLGAALFLENQCWCYCAVLTIYLVFTDTCNNISNDFQVPF